MDTRGTRRELAASVRLLAGAERRLFAGLLVGAVGYLIWITGTGVAAGQFVTAVVGPVSVDPWSAEAAGLTALLALLWVVGPSLLAVRLVVGALTNLRGNIDQRYRLERPLVLLVPPLAALVVVLAVTVARGTVGPAVLVALGFVNVVLLIRTVAYGYRVYSLSVPLLLQTALLVAALGVSLAVVSRTAALAGQDALVRAAASEYGVDRYAFGTFQGWGLDAPFLPLAGAVLPGAIALSYVWFQILASLIVRARRPNVPRSAIRPGQRYPQVVQPGTSRRLAMGTAAETDGTDADDGGASGLGSDPDGATGDPTPDASDDRFGQTRVYTPPDDGDDGDAGGATVKSELCPICGDTYAADAGHTQCPNCNAVLESG